jgi:hypothetical protein
MGTPGLGPVGIALNVSADGSHLAEAAELERLSSLAEHRLPRCGPAGMAIS